MRQALILLPFLFVAKLAVGQEIKVTNQGVLSVKPSTVVTFTNDFYNTDEGDVRANGVIYYQGNFTNDNFFNAPNGKENLDKDATVYFTKLGTDSSTQVVGGSQPAYFQNLVFDREVVQDAFELKSEINVLGTASFKKGIVKVNEQEQGMITFQKKAVAAEASNASYVDGAVEKIGNTTFTYPYGNKGVYRYAKISAPTSDHDVYTSKYVFGDPNFFSTKKNKTSTITVLDESEYWHVEKGSKNSKDGVLLTLSWSESTTPQAILEGSSAGIHIIRWDEQKRAWVDEGGVVDPERKEVTTLARLKDYGYFTLGRVDEKSNDDLIIYNYVATNDENNNFFRIENINYYPKNTVEIFNRWGARVFQQSGYDENDKVFRGYANGKGVLRKGDKLPSGTYFYILQYEKSTNAGSQTIKRSGYIHLETN